MSFYKKAFNEKFGVYYPAAVTVGNPVPVKNVAKRLSRMCTVTYADVMAVLGELPGVMADYMAQGKSVRLDGLGTDPLRPRAERRNRRFRTRRRHRTRRRRRRRGRRPLRLISGADFADDADSSADFRRGFRG